MGPSSAGRTLVWPAHAQHFCGTPELAAAGAPVKRYAPGSGGLAWRGWGDGVGCLLASEVELESLRGMLCEGQDR